MNKFEEDLKYASTIKGGDFMGWLQTLASELIKQREYSYGQDFLKLQGSVYELIFKPDGILHISFQATQQRFGLLEDTIIFVRLLHQLSPNEQSFYSSLPSEYPLNQVQTECLPAHIQLYLKDRSIASQNPQFQLFQEIFKDNIVEERNQVKFCVSAKMMFWIHLLHGASNFRESAVSVIEHTQKFMDGAFAKYKRRINTKDHLLKQLAFNPYVVIIRRILDSMVASIKHNNIVSNQNKQLMIFTFQQMIILLQEYTLFEHVYVTKLLDLQLNPEQQKIFTKIKPSSIILDTQMMLIYLTIFFNSLNGTELETIYQQYKPFLKNSDILFNKSPAQYLSRGFFFECGRQKQLVTYQQALYKLLTYSFEVYPHEKQCTQITILSHLSTYVLFLRGQFSMYEITLYNQVQLFDKAVFQCLISQNKALIHLAQRHKVQQYKGSNPVLRAIISEVQPIWSILKEKFSEAPQTIIFRDFRPQNFMLVPFDTKFQQNEYSLDFHYKELDAYKNQMNNLVRLHYPFYTKLLIQIFKCISQLDQLSKTEYQGVIHLLTFMFSYENNSFFCGIIKSLPVKPFQAPSYQEVKNFCDIYVPGNKEEDFLIKSDIKSDLKSSLISDQKIDPKTVPKIDTKQCITQIICLIMQHQQKSNRLIQYLSQTFEITVEKIRISPGRITLNPQKRQSRLSKPRKSINQWKAPIRDDEYQFLFTIMWYCSLFCDKISGTTNEEYPSTQWPRKFAAPINLMLAVLGFLLVVTFFRRII